MVLYASTKNKGKLREFLRVSDQVGLQDLLIETLPGIESIPAPEENGSTFEENAILKAAYYSRCVEGLVFADDSGLEVAALGGAPGVRSARYAGDDASDAENNALLLRNLDGTSNRAARFVCAIALARSGQLLHTTFGYVDGEILTAQRGQDGFGYDPLFYFPRLGRTFAELSHGEKFEISHRGRAFRALIEWLASQPGTL